MRLRVREPTVKTAPGPEAAVSLEPGLIFPDSRQLTGNGARLRLRTLGRVDLSGVGARDDVATVLSQPKRTALLCYLALASPVGYHRRDTVLGLFWPDLDTDHARGALNQALRYLRRALGNDVIVSRGTADIGVDEAKLWCDAVAFRYAAAKGRFRDALALYAGPLLDGFFIQDAPSLDGWLEAERRSLVLAAERVAWKLAEQESERGNMVEAGLAALRAADLRRHDESVHQRLLRFLVSIGDRSGALRAHEVFCRRLARDLEIGPTPQTVTLVQNIRASRGVARQTEGPRRDDVRVAAHVSVPEMLVHDFAALGGDESDQAFATGLAEDIRATLSAHGDVRLIAHDQRRRSSLDAMDNRRAPVPRSRRLFVLRGSVRIVDARLRVVARLNCTHSGHTVWTDTFDMAYDDTLAIQQGLAATIGKKLIACVRDNVTPNGK